LGRRWWRLCGQQPVVLPPFSPSLFSPPRLGNGVGGAAVVLLVRVCCLCQQRPPLSTMDVLLTAHGAGGNRGTGGAAWPVVLLPFSALSSVSGLLCSSYLSSKSSSFFLLFCPSFTPLKNKLSPLFSVLPPPSLSHSSSVPSPKFCHPLVSFFSLFSLRFCSLLPSSLQKISPPSSCLSLSPKNRPPFAGSSFFYL